MRIAPTSFLRLLPTIFIYHRYQHHQKTVKKKNSTNSKDRFAVSHTKQYTAVQYSVCVTFNWPACLPEGQWNVCSKLHTHFTKKQKQNPIFVLFPFTIRWPRGNVKQIKTTTICDLMKESTATTANGRPTRRIWQRERRSALDVPVIIIIIIIITSSASRTVSNRNGHKCSNDCHHTHIWPTHFAALLAAKWE